MSKIKDMSQEVSSRARQSDIYWVDDDFPKTYVFIIDVKL